METGTIVTIQTEGQKLLGVVFKKIGEQFSVFKTNLQPNENEVKNLTDFDLDRLFKYPLMLLRDAELKSNGMIAEKVKDEIQALNAYRQHIKKLSFEELQVEAQEILGEGETAKYNLIIEECNRRHP